VSDAPAHRNVADAAVTLSGLTRRFGPLTAVDDLSFEVSAGELFGIVGPDGAGKTTTLRMLAAVLPPSAGDAVVAGVSVTRDPEGVKPHIAYMAQRFGLYQDLTVAENLDFYADLYRVPRADRPARLERLYQFSNLGEFTERLAGALSGGMKQKLSLSCALIHQPRVLLLDEPTFGVDPISRRDLWLILHEMVAEGVTVIVSTSYRDEAERCDRVALLNRGEVVALDEPHALQKGMPGRLAVVRADDPRRARDVLRATEGVVSASLFGESIHVVLAEGRAIETVSRAVEAHGLRVLDLRDEEPGLEDVFIRQVAGAEAGR
jgi:ABC-2 type transport system ATP-binding protein